MGGKHLAGDSFFFWDVRINKKAAFLKLKSSFHSSFV